MIRRCDLPYRGEMATDAVFPMDWIVKEVALRLSHKRLDSPEDIYVWSDGSVTGPKDNESEVGDLKVVSVFSPTDDETNPAAIRASIENGLATADDRRDDSPRIRDEKPAALDAFDTDLR